LRNLFGGLIGLLACFGLLAACGGGSDETSEALTKAEFIAQGDEICADGEKEVEDGAEAFAEENDVDTENPTQAEQEEVVADVFVPSLRKQADELSELGAPEGEEGEVEAIVSALEEASDELEDDPGLLFSSGGGPLDKPTELAAEFGFEECGS
jgi:hypothetical protein